jgi:hypothetical protein
MSNKNLNLIINCPHCNEPVIIDELNCKIFRHAIFKNSGLQINPHATKLECDSYIENNLIFGCGRPFRIIDIDNKYNIEKCDYI